jgi:hypothetical protein
VRQSTLKKVLYRPDTLSRIFEKFDSYIQSKKNPLNVLNPFKQGEETELIDFYADLKRLDFITKVEETIDYTNIEKFDIIKEFIEVIKSEETKNIVEIHNLIDQSNNIITNFIFNFCNIKSICVNNGKTIYLDSNDKNVDTGITTKCDVDSNGNTTKRPFKVDDINIQNFQNILFRPKVMNSILKSNIDTYSESDKKLIQGFKKKLQKITKKADTYLKKTYTITKAHIQENKQLNSYEKHKLIAAFSFTTFLHNIGDRSKYDEEIKSKLYHYFENNSHNEYFDATNYLETKMKEIDNLCSKNIVDFKKYFQDINFVGIIDIGPLQLVHNIDKKDG